MYLAKTYDSMEIQRNMDILEIGTLIDEHIYTEELDGITPKTVKTFIRHKKGLRAFIDTHGYDVAEVIEVLVYKYPEVFTKHILKYIKREFNFNHHIYI
jgi:endonuclease III